MKHLLLSILILFLISPFAYAKSGTDYFPLLIEGDYLVYQDQIKIQNQQGNFEVHSKSLREKVLRLKINDLRTLKVLLTEVRDNFKTVKMQEENFQDIKTSYYI